MSPWDAAPPPTCCVRGSVPVLFGSTRILEWDLDNLMGSLCTTLSPLDTLFIVRWEGESVLSLAPVPFRPAAVAEEGLAHTLDLAERMAVLPLLRVLVSLLRLRVPAPPTTCFTTTGSMLCFGVLSLGALAPSLVMGRSGDFTREIDDLGIGCELPKSLAESFFFMLLLATTEDLPLVDWRRVDFRGDLTSAFLLTSPSLCANLAPSAVDLEDVSADVHRLEGGRGGNAAVKVDCFSAFVGPTAAVKSK